MNNIENKKGPGTGGPWIVRILGHQGILLLQKLY